MQLIKPLRTIVVLLALLASGAASAQLYVANNQDENLYVVDVNAVTGSLVGSTGVDLGFGGLGFASNGTLYAVTRNELYTVDLGSGAFNSVGALGTNCIDTFDIRPTDDAAMAFHICDEEVYDVDLGSGAATLRVASTGNLHASSAFASDGTLFQLQISAGFLETVDVDTGDVSTVGATGIPSQTITNLAFNPADGMLYAVGLSSAELFRIDPSDGSATSLGIISGIPADGQYTMSTFQVNSRPAPGPSVPIPTLSQWGLLMLLLTMAGMAWVALSRRSM